MKKILIFAAVVLILGVFGFSAYNSLVSLEENTTAELHQIDNQLQRRSDLIPNLVNTVKGYAKHEQDAIDKVVLARAALAGSKNIGEKAQADASLTSAMKNLFVIIENYPQLKADTTFKALMDELAGTENRIAVARKDYNDSVKKFNAKIKMLPYSLFAKNLGFEKKEYFEVSQSAKELPQVAF
jgi:LemA protein